MKKWRKVPSLMTLSKVAFGGAVFVGLIRGLVEYGFQKKVRQTSTYKRVLDIFRSNEKAVKYLGEPIEEGKVKIKNSKDNTRRLMILMKGSNTKGWLDCEYKVVADSKTEIQKLELSFNNIPDKVYLLHKI